RAAEGAGLDDQRPGAVAGGPAGCGEAPTAPSDDDEIELAHTAGRQNPAPPPRPPAAPIVPTPFPNPPPPPRGRGKNTPLSRAPPARADRGKNQPVCRESSKFGLIPPAMKRIDFFALARPVQERFVESTRGHGAPVPLLVARLPLPVAAVGWGCLSALAVVGWV